MKEDECEICGSSLMRIWLEHDMKVMLIMESMQKNLVKLREDITEIMTSIQYSLTRMERMMDEPMVVTDIERLNIEKAIREDHAQNP